MWNRRTLIAIAGALALTGLTTLAAVEVVAMRKVPFLASVETWLADFRIATLLPAEPQSPDIAIVSITEETLEPFLYRSPVDRHFLAELVRTLAERGVRGILLDVLFDQPTEPDKDAELEQTLTALSVPLVISYAHLTEGLTAHQAAFLDHFVPPRLRGFSNVVTDPWNATVRWIYPGRVGDDGVFIPGVVSALAAKLGYQPWGSDQAIAWRGRPSAGTSPFRSFPAHLVADLPAVWFKDKIIFIGADLTLTDRHRTPFAAAFAGRAGYLPGVVIHAHGLNQLMTARPSPFLSERAEIALIAALALTGTLLGRLGLSLALRILAAGLVLAALWGGGFYVFEACGLLIPLVGPSLAFAIAHWLSDAYSSSEARRQRRFIKEAFGRYLSRPLVEHLLREPDRLALGGERRRITILFTDIADFTRLSEQLEPVVLSRLVNSYFEGVCGAVLSHGGMVNEFIGDAVLAFFGAPVVQPDHAARALACARAIDAFSEGFRAEMAGSSIPLGATRIGIHTGEVMLGNFGSKDRFKYSALGDTVNTASRIEGLNKYFGSRAMASGSTVSEAGDGDARPVGPVVVKGRSEPLPVFDLTPGPDAAQRERYHAAFTLLEQGRTEAALAAFAALAADVPTDRLAAFHLSRLKAGATGTLIVMSEK